MQNLIGTRTETEFALSHSKQRAAAILTGADFAFCKSDFVAHFSVEPQKLGAFVASCP